MPRPWAWSRRRLGDRGHEYVVRPLVEPLFGVGCESLGVPYLLGLLRAVHTVGFRVPEHGMSSLARALTAGADVRTGHRVGSIATDPAGVVVRGDFDDLTVAGVIVATDAPTAAGLLGSALGARVSSVLRAVPYATMKHVVLGYERDPWPTCELEMLLPVGPGAHPVAGLILHARRTPAGVPAGGQLVSAYVDDARSRTCSDDEAVELALDAVRTLLGSRPVPTFVRVFTHRDALSLATPGHHLAMQALLRSLPPGIRVAGDYLAHLGVESAVVSGLRAAREISR